MEPPDQAGVVSAVLRRLGYVAAAGSVLYGIRRRDRATRLYAEKQQAIYGAVVEHSDDAIISVRLDGRVVAWNSGAERLFGYTRAEALSCTDCASLPPGGAVAPALVARLAAGERGIQYETRARHKDGSPVDVWVTVSPVLDHAGTVIGTATISRDLSATKAAEAGRRAAEERADHAQRMASLGQLAGGVAHDFNNLLGIILSFIDFAAEDAGANEPVQTDLAKARRAAERAAGLTSQLLTFTRQDTVRPRLLDVNDSVDEVRDLLARTIGSHITLVATRGPEPLTIVADEGHVQQVLVNLALNARDAMPDGGTLLIEAARSDDQVVITVGDTGTGMPPEVTARIFEPFFTTKPTGSGTGLGLATVYGIVTAAGGTIDVTSEQGKGTTFQARFPYAVGEPQVAMAAEQPPQGHGETILITDDEPALAETAARILTTNGYQVLTATTGPQALALAAAHPYDLLLTDVTMPDMSGRDLALRMRESHPATPVLYMSGYTNGLLDAAGEVHVVQKPFTPNALLTALHQALPPSRAGGVSPL